MDKDEKRAEALRLLTEKHRNTGELPKRSDFSPQEVCFIKQKLGPWPRALEAAGLKPAQKITTKEKSRLRRERIKRERKRTSVSAEKVKAMSELKADPADNASMQAEGTQKLRGKKIMEEEK